MRITGRIAATFAALAMVPLGAVAVAQGASNWGATVTENDGGHLLGNPEAEIKLVEYVSYTCSHCAEFARKGEGAVKLAYVPTGKVSFEIRHLLRDSVDLTVAMLTHCGDPEKFPINHTAMMYKQDEWFERARNSTQAQRARWQFGSNAARRQAIASDLGFYDIMEDKGYGRVELDRCLSDEDKAKTLAETSRRDIETHSLQGTPTFLINGEKLDGVFAWETLEPELNSRI